MREARRARRCRGRETRREDNSRAEPDRRRSEAELHGAVVGAASNDAVSSGSGVNACRMDRRACAAGSASVGCRDSAVTAQADQAATEAADARR